MVEKALSNKDRFETVLDPAAGCGSLLSAVLIKAKEKNVTLN
jgi:type I restriction-modification system DNA methylase subunit